MFEFYKEHELSDNDAYRSVLHELRDGDQQMVVIHMDVKIFAPGVMKQMIREFAALRSCTDAPIFAIEPSPDNALWQRYVSHMGFDFSSRVECTDGLSRRCFVSNKKNNNDHFKHFAAEPDGPVERPAALPDAGVRAGVL